MMKIKWKHHKATELVGEFWSVKFGSLSAEIVRIGHFDDEFIAGFSLVGLDREEEDGFVCYAEVATGEQKTFSRLEDAKSFLRLELEIIRKALNDIC